MPTAPDRHHRYAAPERMGLPRDLSRPLPAAVSWWTLAVFLVGFAVAFVILSLPWWMPALYGAMSLVAVAAYGLDKAAARRDGQRISEKTLITIGMLCGWPGALVAQQLFRHKTRKKSFRRAFWRSVVLNILLLVAFIALATLQGWDLALPRVTDLAARLH